MILHLQININNILSDLINFHQAIPQSINKNSQPFQSTRNIQQRSFFNLIFFSTYSTILINFYLIFFFSHFMDCNIENDAIASMVSTISELEKTKQELHEQNKKLSQLIQDLLGYDINSKKCLHNHPLCYIPFEKGFMKQSYYCDKCKIRCDKVSTVRWTCKQCNYDACVKCEGYRKSVCPYMHVLNPKIIPENQNSFKICDICLKQIVGTHYTCGCNFDICKNCKEK